MCRPYGFGSHADMAEITLRPITNSGIWIPMMAPTCSTMISSDEPRCQGLNRSRIQFPLSIVCYLPEIRSSVSNTLFNLVTGKSLYSFRNTSSRDQLLGHICANDDVLPSGPRDTSPFTRSDKSQSRFVPTQQTLSEIPIVYLYSHPVTL